MEAVELSQEYQAAIWAHNWAIERYRTAQLAYRSFRIGDEEFLKARKRYDEATEKFDEAFALESKRLGN